MPDRFARQIAFCTSIDQLLAEADALGLDDVAIDLDHARNRLTGWANEDDSQKSLVIALAIPANHGK